MDPDKICHVYLVQNLHFKIDGMYFIQCKFSTLEIDHKRPFYDNVGMLKIDLQHGNFALIRPKKAYMILFL